MEFVGRVGTFEDVKSNAGGAKLTVFGDPKLKTPLTTESNTDCDPDTPAAGFEKSDVSEVQNDACTIVLPTNIFRLESVDPKSHPASVVAIEASVCSTEGVKYDTSGKSNEKAVLRVAPLVATKLGLKRT